MAWDPALLRKYNTTSHFRLLNQIRTELRDQPIQRPLVTSRAAAQAGGGGFGGRRSSRSSEPVSTAPDRSGRRRPGAVAPTPAQPLRDDAPQMIVAVPVLTDLVLPDAHT
jgi:hypothetical protein